MKYFYIIANLSKEYVKDAQVFIKTYPVSYTHLDVYKRQIHR